jgi:hypothetical protein
MSAAATGAARRRRRTRRTAAGVLALLLFLLVPAVALPACGGNADPFTGLYWEPSSGRRVEIRKAEEGYLLYYGAAKRPFKATREGDELRIAEPMGGQTVVRLGDDETTLELETAGKTSLLKRLQQHQ